MCSFLGWLVFKPSVVLGVWMLNVTRNQRDFVALFGLSIYFSGLSGCNKDVTGFELSYHSGPDDLIAEVCQMFFYSHCLNDILQYGASDQFARMMTYSCSRLVPIRTIVLKFVSW